MRLLRVKSETFQRKVTVVSGHLAEARIKSGRPPKHQVLMTLKYWREYRTFFHLARSWGSHESSVRRAIRRMEDILTKSKAFTLPGKKKLQLADHEIEFIVVDVAGTPIERPKKAESLLQRQEEAAHLEKPGGRQRAHSTSHPYGAWSRHDS